jgi:LmbE family N-acetylglucosaminyl deacetylase
MDPVPEDWQRAVVVVAHPDDIEYGAAAAVARWTRQGKDVRYVLATRGEAGIAGLPPAQSAPVREDEERESARIVGVESVEFLGHADGLLVAGPELRRDIAAAIRRHRPQMVVTAHFGETWLPGILNSADHRALGICVLDAVADAANEWIFPELTEPRWSGVKYIAVSELLDAPHEVDVSDQVEKAVASLCEHRRYLELISDDPVDMQARQIVDMSTLAEDGTRRVGFRLFWG